MSKATIHYYDIGDYLSREEKLSIIKKFGSISNIPWRTLEPNEYGDWISLRNDVFGSFIPLEPEKKFDNKNQTVFIANSNGVKTNRDAWCYNSNKAIVTLKITETIDFYNQQCISYNENRKNYPLLKVENFIKFDSIKISWDRENKADVFKNVKYNFDKTGMRLAIYRPFFKQIMYFNRKLNNCIYQQLKLFPKPNLNNLVICVSGVGVTKDFSCIISDTLPDLELIGKSQCFPLYYYEERAKSSPTLFDSAAENEFIRRDGISDFILERAKQQYGLSPSPLGRAGVGPSKEDIFYYVYGILHSPDYRTAFANDLKKMLPRIPLVEDVRDFWKFSKAGRALADLHINYESVPPYAGVKVLPLGEDLGGASFLVEKMRFPKKGQKDTIIYNSHITISNIPEKAYEYVVNGKSAIEWIMERYAITVHKESGIKNDPNDWAKEVGNPRYILDLLLSIINVSVQTVEIVEGLPGVRFE